MSYTFKRLAEVEEIQEAPETAKAFVEVNGEVKRAPYGAGGAKIEDLRFNLDFEHKEYHEEGGTGGGGSSYWIELTNAEQIKRILENDMTVVVIRKITSSHNAIVVDTYYRCNTLMNKSSNIGYAPFSTSSENGYSYDYGWGAMMIVFDSYDNTIPINAQIIEKSGEYVAVYATV